MAYIYCITNIVNGKKYIGKTINSITKRFRQHLSDSKRPRCNKRPLYSAINKYGADNFVVEKLIECHPDELSSYEIMFIEKYIHIIMGTTQHLAEMEKSCLITKR